MGCHCHRPPNLPNFLLESFAPPPPWNSKSLSNSICNAGTRMTPRSVNSRHAVDSCALQLHSWKPFQIQTLNLDNSMSHYPFYSKKPCLSDRSTAPGEANLDLSKLTLVDDPNPQARPREEGFRWFARKRRRHAGPRSVSGRSSDRSGTRRTCCSVGGGGGGASGAYATCSDFPVAAGGTDSSGELFMNGDGNWGSDASEARVSRKEGKDGGGGGGGVGLDRDSVGFGSFLGGSGGVSDLLGNDSGYGSETGYKGDAEFGYEDEFEEEEEDGRLLFWGDQFGDITRMDFAGKSAFLDLKSHPRCRRKKVIGE